MDFDFEEAVSHWVTGPYISTLIDYGPWWYYENKPTGTDNEIAALAEKMLRQGMLRRETWMNDRDMITRYTSTPKGREAMRDRRKKLDEKFKEI